MAKNNEDNVVLKIIVDDTGIGMPPERQQDIYLQFKRLTASYKGIYKGYGLGLSITKQLIDDLNGEIYVESQLGTGSKFTFIVKLKKALLDEQLGSEDLLHSFTGKNFISPIESESVEDTNKDVLLPYKSHILVVEDSSMAAYIAMNMLSKMHCIVDIAGTGNQAVELAEKKQYDLLFMDIGLPDIDGYEATKRIRLNETNRNHVPIVALTAHASEENKKYCIDIGMNAVLIKPLLQEKAEEFLDFFIPYRKKRLKLKETATVV
jgi:CheY-like chemotaxis protein